MSTFIIYALLGDYSETVKELEKQLVTKEVQKITPEFIDKLSLEDSRELSKQLLEECKILRGKITPLEEELNEMYEIYSRIAAAFGEITHLTGASKNETR